MIGDITWHDMAVVLSVSFLVGKLMDMLLQRLSGKAKYIGVSAVVVTFLFIGTYGMGYHALAGILFGQVLVFAAGHDITSHTVPDYVPVLVLLTGLMEVRFFPAMLGLVLVPLPFLVMAFIREKSIGGADIKLMGASGFVLGVSRGYVALVLGLSLAVLCRRAFGGKKEEAFALVPYLSLGCIVAALLT